MSAFERSIADAGQAESVAAETFYEILKKNKVKPTAIALEDGSLISALSPEQKAMIERDFAKATSVPTDGDKRRKDDAARKARDESWARKQREINAKQGFAKALTEQILSASEAAPPVTLEWLRIMVYGYWYAMEGMGGTGGLKRLGVTLPDEYTQADEHRIVREAIARATPEELSIVMLQFTLRSVDCYWEDDAMEGSVQREIAELYGIDHVALKKQLVDDVLDPPKKKSKAPAAVKYHNTETGETWSGRGKQPAWLEGKNLEEYLA